MGEEDTERLDSLRPKNLVLEVALVFRIPPFSREGGDGVLLGIFLSFTGTVLGLVSVWSWRLQHMAYFCFQLACIAAKGT